jgi:hypothetical protein
MGQFFNLQDLGAIAPELELMLFGMILLIADLLVENKKWLGYISLGGIAWSGYFLIRLYGIQPVFAYNGLLIIDPFSWFFKLLFLIAAALTIIISMKYLDIEREHHGEFYALILFAFSALVSAVHVPNGTFIHSAIALAPQAYILALEGVVAVAAWLGLRTDPAAIDLMKHPERSPYAFLGPPGAKFGNDEFFLRDPLFRPSQTSSHTLDGPLSWRIDGGEFLPEVKALASELGYA